MPQTRFATLSALIWGVDAGTRQPDHPSGGALPGAGSAPGTLRLDHSTGGNPCAKTGCVGTG